MPLVSKTFDQLIDFTRTTSGTFVGSNGLIQTTPASVNLLLQTQQFDNAAWTKTNTTVTANSTVAPDGTSTADKLVENTANGIHSAAQASVTVVSGTTYAFSAYVKAAERDFALIQSNFGNNVYGTVNLSTGATNLLGGTGTLNAVSVGNGWWRISLIAASSATSAIFNIYTATNSTTFSYTGDGTSGIFLWGAQVEAASAATTYTRNNGGRFPPRFDYDPVTLAAKGLLIEEQRTNLLTYSAQFDNAAWTKGGASVTANSTTSPDGTANADTLTEDTSTGDHRTFQNVATTNGTSYAFSVYAKPNGRSLINLTLAGAGEATYNISTGVVTNTVSGTAEIQSAGNGWYRCVIRLTATTTSYNAQIRLVSTGTTTSYTGDGTSGIYLWGAQLEAGAFATSYIPTVASQVTRTADVAAIVAPNFAPWYNQSEGSFVAEVSLNNAPATTTFSLYTVSDNTNNERIYVGTGSGGFGNINTVVTDGGVLQAQTINSGLTSAGTYKYANAYKVNDFASVANGGVAATDTSGTVPTVDRLFIGLSAAGAVPINGHIRSIRYYPTRLSNAQLQALTA